MKQQYDLYKPSGIDWIGDIPSHWVSKRLRYVCEFRNGYTPSKANGEYWSDGTIPWYRMEDIRESGRFLKESKQSISKEAVKGCGLFEAGSFILATTATIGEHAMLIVDSLANQRFTNLKIRKSLNHTVTKEFFFYYLFVIDEFCKSTTKTTTFPAMDMTDLRNFGVSIPPLAEQEAIAAWLDEKCGEIDAAIAKVDREIELIDELKQSEISHVVTRGLNPDTPLRPSGIDWIGDVPEHWTISPIKHICRSEKYSIKTGPFGSQLKGEDLKEEGDVRVYNQRNVIDNDFSVVSNYVISAKAKDLESFYTLPNDILVTSRGTIGKSAILPDDVDMGILHPCLIALRIDESKANLNWVQRWINESDAFSRDIEAKSNATTIDVIYTETIKNVRIALPPLSEQEAIADYLDKKCAEIDGLKVKLNKKRETLTELRQSIISEVVTGKRKVI